MMVTVIRDPCPVSVVSEGVCAVARAHGRWHGRMEEAHLPRAKTQPIETQPINAFHFQSWGPVSMFLVMQVARWIDYVCDCDPSAS